MLSDASGLCDLGIERTLIADVLLDAEVWWRIIDRVSASDFSDPRHASIWQAIAALVARGVPVDYDTIHAELLRRDLANSAGGRQYLSEATDRLPMPWNCEAHADIVRNLARVRALSRAAASVAAMAQGFGADADGYVDAAMARIGEASDGGRRDDGQCSMADAVDLALSDHDDATGAPTAHWPHPTVEAVTGGLCPGQLVVIAARPGVGKSALALELAIEAAAAGAVFFASLEMTRVEVSQRALAMVSGVSASLWKRPADRARLARAQPDRMQAVTAAANDLHQRGIAIADGGRQTVASIHAAARRLQARGPLALVVVDYLQLVQGAAGLGRETSREQVVAGIARGLKLLANELKVPVVALSQLNRDADGTVPTLAMLRESGALEQDANTVIFLHPPSDNDAASPVFAVDLIIAKQRSGAAGVSVPLAFTRDTTSFAEITDAGGREARNFTPKRRRKLPDDGRPSHVAPRSPGVVPAGDALDAFDPEGGGLPGADATALEYAARGAQYDAGAA